MALVNPAGSGAEGVPSRAAPLRAGGLPRMSFSYRSVFAPVPTDRRTARDAARAHATNRKTSARFLSGNSCTFCELTTPLTVDEAACPPPGAARVIPRQQRSDRNDARAARNPKQWRSLVVSCTRLARCRSRLFPIGKDSLSIPCIPYGKMRIRNARAGFARNCA